MIEMQSRNENNIPGIDVSKYQGTVDWLKVAADGFKFAFVKASEGVGYIDPCFRRNAVGAPAAGLKVGFYHYARPETGNTPQAEAEHFLETIGNLPSELPHVLDVEGEAAKLGSTLLTDWCCEWLDTVERRSKHRVMVYTGASFARSYLGAKLAQWPLWVAHYGVDRPLANGTWERWAVFQYTSDGRSNGINGRVDLNEMDVEFWREITEPKIEEDENDMPKLDPGVAQTIINTWISPSWFAANEQMKRAKDSDSKKAWRTQRDYYHWLANQLREAAGLPLE